MSYTTNVPDVEFTPQGLVLPDESAILAGVLADFNAAFGGNLNIKNLETPQGQLASSLAAIIANKNNQLAWLVNNLDPAYSDGFMQDAIARFYFIERKGQINSTVNCIFTGLKGTVIPSGFIVKDQNGNEWTLNNSVMIGNNGKVSAVLTANGIYTAPPHSVTEMKQSIIGVDRVDNEEGAIEGIPMESRADFEARRINSVSINSQSMVSSVYANVSAISGVTDCYAIDNPTNKTVHYGKSKYPIKPHSIYVAVQGGDDNEIAKAIWTYSGNGCDFNGDTVIKVEDETYDVPRPTYEIKFVRPSQTPLFFQVKIKKGLVDDYVEEMKQAIISTFNESSRFRIGKTYYAVDYVCAIKNILPTGYLLDVKIGIDNQMFGEQVEIGIDQFPVVLAENILTVN